jgi:hypothetical protein
MDQSDLDPVFKSLIGMGAALKIYKQNRIASLSEIFSFLFMTVSGFGMIYYAPIVYKRDGISIETIMFVLGAPSFLSIGLYFLWRVFYWWNDIVVLYQNGVAYQQRKGMTTFKWNEITSIKIEAANFRALGVIPSGKVRDYRIANSSTQLRMASTLDQIDDLMSEIRKNTFTPMLARLRQEFDTGRSIRFGSVTIHKDGVQWKSKKYSWKDLAQAGIANGTIHYIPKNRNPLDGIHVMARDVINFDVLLALSNELIKQNS